MEEFPTRSRHEVTPSRLALLVALAVLGCRSAAPPPAPTVVPPAAALDVAHWAGTPLSGPTGAELPDAALADALDVRVTFVALDSLPASAGIPIEDLVRLVVLPDAEQPLAAAPMLARGARVTVVDDGDAFVARVAEGELGRSAPLGALDAALPRGVTACLRAAEPPDRAAAILVRRASAGIEVVLSLHAGAQTGRELVVLDPRAESRSPVVALVFPSPFSDGGGRAIVAVVDVRTTPRDAAKHAAAVARCRTDLAQSTAPAERPPATREPVEPPANLGQLVDALGDAANRRPVLAYLAVAVDAPAAVDVALVGTEAVVSELADAARRDGASDLDRLAWTLESTGLRLLAESAAGETSRPDLESALARRAGQAAREPLDLRALVEDSRDRADLERRLVEFNLDALEDPSPAARLRAFEWLAARGQEPAGYDPLGPPKDRRAALERSLEAAEVRQP
jgi:hypothetical protein